MAAAEGGAALKFAVDIGFNAGSKQFGKGLPAVLLRAAAAGVRSTLITGVDVPTMKAAAALCTAQGGELSGVALSFTAGVHPHDAKVFKSSGALEVMRGLAGDEYCKAIGECGLDYNRNFSPKEAQLEAFTAQVQLACELNMPLFLHQRDAHDDFLKVMDAHWTKAAPAVVHCFTGTPAQAAAYVERGMFVGLTGTVCMPRRGAGLRKALAGATPSLPLSRLLLETDAPFMHPYSEGSIALPTAADPAAVRGEEGAPATAGGGRKGRGRRRRKCEPRHLMDIVATVAATLGCSQADVIAATTANAMAVFGVSVATAPLPAATAAGAAEATAPAASAVPPPAAPPTKGAPAAVQDVETVTAEALAGRFVDTHIHLDEVLSALKVDIPSPGLEGGGASGGGDADLAAAIAASLADAGLAPPAAAGEGGGAPAPAQVEGAGAVAGLHPVLASLFGEQCDGVVAQFCDPAAVSPSLAVYEALLGLPGVRGAFGCHPHHAKYYSDSWEARIRTALAHPGAVALGECGLDYAKKQSPRDVQRRVLVRQIALAVELGKPLVIHCRDAEADLLVVFGEHLPPDWLVHLHCYTGGAAHAEALVAGWPNLHFGFTGFITQNGPGPAGTREAIRTVIPPNRILFETDGPWMSPRVRGAHPDLVLPVLQRLYETGRYASKTPPATTAAGGGGGKRGKGQGAVGCGARGQTSHAGAIPAIAAVVAREAGVGVGDLMVTVRENTKRVYSI